MADQDINTINDLPDQTAPSATAGLRVFEDAYNSGRDHDSTTGKRSLGLADPQDVSAELVPTLESVTAGAQNISIEELVTGYNGTAKVVVQDQNTNIMEVGMGTTASTVEDTEPTVPITGVVAATGSTLNTIVLGTGEGADFIAHIGKQIEVPTASGSKLRAYVGSVSVDTITTFYPMDELPFPTGTVRALEGFQQEIGGGQLSVRELLFAQDFSNGASHRTKIHRVQAIGGWKPMMNQGAKIKRSAEFKIQGVSRPVGGRSQLVPVTIYGKYGLAPVVS